MPIPNFDDLEIAITQSCTDKRWDAGTIELVLADLELFLKPDDKNPILCPAVFWQANGCSFIVQKTGERAYGSRFFYSDLEQYGTGIEEYDDLATCTMTLLQIQADDESVRLGNFPGAEPKT